MNIIILEYKKTDKSKYLNLYKKYKELTLLDDWRYPFLLYLLDLTKEIKGDICEVGVYKGGTALGMTEIVQNSDKNLYLFDTFTGVAISTKGENGSKYDMIHNFEEYNISQVQTLFNDIENVKIIQGDAMDTLQETKMELSFCHLDLNYYKSTLHCLNLIYNKMVKGGIIIIDDYGFEEYKEIVKKAVDEFLKTNNINGFPVYTGQYVIIK